MKRACIGIPGRPCGRILDRGNRCEPCQSAKYRLRNQQRDPFAKRLYSSSAWKQIRDRVVRSADRCFYCGRSDVKLTADHVVAIRIDPSRALDPTNIVAADRSCQERRKHDPQWWGDR
jgi:5-methylcytosine-specific restriction endonuclease McrA